MAIALEFKAAQTNGGFFDLTDWGVVEISGPDARDYLQRMTTADFRNPSPNRVADGAWLNGKGQVQTLGVFLEVAPETFEYWVPPFQASAAAEYIEKFHFSERLTVTDKSPYWALLGLWYPTTQALKEGFPSRAKTPMQSVSEEWQKIPVLIWQDLHRPPLQWVRLERKAAEAVKERMQAGGTPPFTRALFDYFRIEAGVPEFGREVFDKDILLEANFESAVARNKGCYPGQEVIERIFTYGSVNRKLARVKVTAERLAESNEFPLALSAEGTVVGELRSAVASPSSLPMGIGFAMLQKKVWGFSGVLEGQAPIHNVSLL